MKTVKSVSDLKQLALRSGAAVELGNTRFNSAKERVAALQRPAPKAEPVKAPEPTPAPAPAPVVNVDTAPMAAAQERMAQMLSQALASMPAPTAPIREWVFTVERDEKGLLTRIRASAQ